MHSELKILLIGILLGALLIGMPSLFFFSFLSDIFNPDNGVSVLGDFVDYKVIIIQ